MSSQMESLIGQKFGLLTVVDDGEPYLWRGRVSKRTLVCECDCGNSTTVRSDALRSKHTRSCGCEKVRETVARATRHGARSNGERPTEYDVWRRLRREVREGTIVIPRSWEGPLGYAEFARCVGPRPTPSHRLCLTPHRSARVAANWRWVDNPQRAGAAKYRVTYRGKAFTLREFSVTTGVAYDTLVQRIARGKPLIAGHNYDLGHWDSA